MAATDQLYNMISQGEHQKQDFKFEIEDARKIAKSIVAFANTDGGRLLIGVKDNGKIAGVRSEEEVYMIEAAAEMYSEPSVEFKVRKWNVEKKEVLEVYVPASSRKPHFVLNKNGPKKAYVRKGDQNLAINTAILKYWMLMDQPRGKHFDYGKYEQMLFDYLKENERITFSKYCRLTGLHHDEASDRLARLLLWEVVDLDLSDKGCFYYLNHNAENVIKASDKQLDI